MVLGTHTHLFRILVPPKRVTMDDQQDVGTEGRFSHISHNKKRLMLEALVETGGIINRAAKRVGISRRTHTNWANDDPEYKKEYDDILEDDLDDSEDALRVLRLGKKNAKGEYTVLPDKTALIFHLKTKGKGRGYIERVEVTDSTQFEEEVKKLSTEELLDRAFNATEQLKNLMDG